MKIVNSFTILFYLIIVVSLGAVGYALYWPMTPFTITDFSLSTYEASIGDEICYKVEGIKHHSIPATVTVSLTNGVKVPLLRFDSNIPMGEDYKKKPGCFFVPKVHPGKFKVEWMALYQPNSLRTIPVVALSKCLTIR